MKKLTNFFNCAAKAASKTGGGDSQKNVHHLGVASEMPPRCLRDASVSIYSCQSDFSSRVWKYAACMLMVLFVGVGNVWGEDVTWEGDNTVFVNKKLSDEVTTITVTKDASNSSKKISCINSTSNKQYLSINGGGKYLKFSAPSGYTITNIQMVWMSGAADQALPILFGESISAVGTVESKDKAVTITNGGFKMTSAIAASAGTNCEDPDDIALPKGTRQVMIGRSGAYSIANYTIGEVEETVKFRLAGTSGTYFTTAVGAESTPFIGRVTLTVVPEGYSITYHCNGATSGCPSDVASGATALPSTLATPAKTGYDFDKWYTDEGLTTPATAGAPLTANANLYAGWTEDPSVTKYEVSYNLNGAPGDAPTQEDVAEGASFNLADAPSWAGHVFDGWLCDIDSEVKVAGSSYTMTAAPTTFTAQWKNTYAITYNKGEYGTGTIAGGEKVEGVAFILSSERFTRAGYVQTGWSLTDGGTKAYDLGGSYTTDASREFFPVWTETSTYVASFACGATAPADWTFSNAGTYGDTDATADYVCNFVTAGTSTPKQDPAEGKDGTTDNDVAFAKNTNAIATYDLGAATTVTALNVTLCGGSGSAFNETIEYLGADGSTVKKTYINSLSAGNWNDNLISKTDIIEDVRYIRVHGASKWVAMKAFSVTYVDLSTKYNVSFEKGHVDATGSMDPVQYKEDATVPAPSCGYTRSGYEFDKWSVTGVDGTTEVAAGGTFTMPGNAVTLTAQWVQVFTVTYALNGGTADPAITETPKRAGAKFNLNDGSTIIPPTDKAFSKWNDGTSDYAPGAQYTMPNPGANVMLTAQYIDSYTVTYKANGGTGDDVVVNNPTTIAANTFTAPSGKTFKGWNTQADGNGTAYAVDASVSSTLTLFAQWINIYDITYKDEDKTTTLGVEAGVRADAHPTASGITTTKTMKTFLGWWDNADYTGDAIVLSSYVPTADATFYGKWGKAYATSYDMEAYAVSDGASLETLLENLTAAGYAYTNVNGIDYGHTHNYIYDGMKYKTNDGDLSFNVNAGKLVIVKTGNLPANALTMYINGVADPTVFVGANEAVETHVNNYFYSATEALYRLDIQASKGTCAIKAVTITDPYTVSFDANGGDDVTSLNGTPSVTLPLPTKGTESFLGWFDGETKVGMNGEKYTPTANITLVAHWEAVSTDARLSEITFSAAGTLSPAFNSEVTSYTYTMPYGTASIPTITGATASHAKAQDPIIGEAAAAWGSSQTVQGVAQSGDKKTYTVTMVKASKDGLEIIGAVVTDNTTATVTGLYKGTASVKLSSKKIDSDCYVYVTLKEGQTLQDGDVLVVDVYAKADIGTKALEICTGEGNLDNGILTSVAVDDYSTGENSIILASVPAGATSIGLKRSANLNAKINGLKVYRAMNPVMTAITIDERAGEADELVENKFNVTIPYEADLASLTVEPTIYRNAAHATTPEAVITNEGAWVLGDNTYRVMDKDGDYTDYTITLTRDELKHTVSFNTHGGSAVASVEVVHGEKLAAEPTEPTKDEYEFLYWAETEDGAEVDVTTVTINADKEFHAVWAAEPEGIKLFDGEGNLNTTNFISAAKTTIEINEVEYPTLVAFGSNRDDLSGAKQADLVMYSATTNATKIKFDLYNNNGSAKTAYLWMVEEGATVPGDPIAIEISGKTRLVTGYYTFNSSKNQNRSFYLTSGSKNDIKVMQVKVMESGSAIPQFGQAGYSVSFNKGRIAVASNGTVSFEGASIHSNDEYSVLNNESIKPKTYIQFNNAVANTTVKIKKASSNAYYVTNDLDNKGTSYTTDQEIVMSTTGTWYIGSVNSGSVAALSKIEFIAPKCEAPAFNALANSDICSGDAYVALDGTGTVSDGGSITYKWYAEGDAETVLATTATYMPEADGSYYVIALHHVDGYTDNEVTSDVVTVTTHAGTEITEGLVDLRGAIDDVVTLSVDAEGANLHYTWKECATIDGTYTDVAGAADAASLEVTVTEGMSKYYKVIVHSDCGDDLESIAHVTQFVPVVQQDVTSSIIWDWTKAASVASIQLSNQTSPKKNEGFVMANGAATIYNNANFESDKLYLEGEYIVRDGKYFQGQMIKFNTTTAGLIRVKFSHTGNNKPARELYINGVGTGDTRTSQTAEWSKYVEVPAGEVSITSYFVDPAEGTGIQYIRVPQIEFYALDKVRDDSWIAPRELGTVCYPNGHIVIGADMYKMAGVNENGKFAFDQVDVTEPGVPYLFEATGYEPIKFYKTTAATAEEAGTSNGMVGTFVQITLSHTTAENTYYFQGAHFYAVTDRSKDLVVPANRCYVDLNEPHPAAAPKAGVRRIVFGVNGTNITTDLENIEGNAVQSAKVLIDGRMYILRGEKMYDATGRLVK